MALGAAPAWGAYVHTNITAEYGKEGPPGTLTGAGCNLAYQSAEHHLYLYSDNLIYGLNRTGPGTVEPLGGNFPIPASLGKASSCGDRDLEVDNTNLGSKGNIYATPSTQNIYGFSATGTALPAPWPVSAGGETCGVAFTNTGEVWGGTYGGAKVTKFNAAGESLGTLPIGTSLCKIAIDPSNNDLYVAPYNASSPIRKYAAATNYESYVNFPATQNSNPGMAINGAQHRLYVASGSTVRSIDTVTGAVVETINLGPSQANSVVVDEPTDTLFVAPFSNGTIKEMPGVVVPDVTTGEPEGNNIVTGTVELAGGGNVIECYFEYGTNTSYGETKNCTPEATPGEPFTEDKAVSAELEGLIGEETYHYRLVAANENGMSAGADKTITPHNVKALHTDPATEIQRASATLNGSFESNEQETEYYFEWGLEAPAYGNETGIEEAEVKPLGENTPTPSEITGLTAGTTYHYRVIATNEIGTSIAQDETFTTSPAIKDIETGAATNVLPTTATLNGSLDPDGYATKFYFQYGKGTSYGLTAPAPPGEDTETTASGSEPVNFDIGDLEAGTEYHFRLVASNETGITFGTDETFTTPQPPSINSFSSTNVTASSADLLGQISPHGYETTYHFDYGTSTAYGSTTAPAVLDTELDAAHNVTVPITGLQGVTYHFRLVAESQWGTTTTNDQTLDFNPPIGCPNNTLRQQTGAAYLPDCRAYELVSAANAGGAVLFSEGPTTPYAVSPGRFSYVGVLNVIPGTGEPPNAGFEGDLYVASRKQDGWSTRYVGVPGYQSIAMSGPPEGANFSLRGIPTDAGMNRFVIWDRGQTGFTVGGTLEGSYAPYIYDNEGNEVGRLPTNLEEVSGSLDDLTEGGYTGAALPSGDLSHYVFTSRETKFTSDGQTTPPGSTYDNDVDEEAVRLVSLTALGANIEQDPVGGTQDEGIDIPAVSTDGTHILMSTRGPDSPSCSNQPEFGRCSSHLYMRVDDAMTYEVSMAPALDGKNHGVKFEGMTADGGTVYFTSKEKLTIDDTDSNTDLFMWKEATDSVTRVSFGTGEANGNTESCGASWIAGCGVEVVDSKAPTGALGNPATDDHAIASMSGDIYFFSPEQLDGARGFLGKRNLYAFGGGKIQHVTTFDPNKGVERINVTPDGRHAAFLSASQLTSYDNHGVDEMYTYDPVARTILCASCHPDGSPPGSQVSASERGLFLTDDGRAFFSTADALVQRDADGILDIYEYVDGRPQLISTGTADNAGNEFQVIGLIGVSADGTDAYFSTYEEIVGQDENGAYLRFYDARTNGGFPFDKPAAPCAAADECHGSDSTSPPSPQIGTSALLGSGGNFHHKKAKKKKRRVGHCRKGRRGKRCRKRKARQAHRRRHPSQRSGRHG